MRRRWFIAAAASFIAALDRVVLDVLLAARAEPTTKIGSPLWLPESDIASGTTADWGAEIALTWENSVELRGFEPLSPSMRMRSESSPPGVAKYLVTAIAVAPDVVWRSRLPAHVGSPRGSQQVWPSRVVDGPAYPALSREDAPGPAE